MGSHAIVSVVLLLLALGCEQKHQAAEPLVYPNVGWRLYQTGCLDGVEQLGDPADNGCQKTTLIAAFFYAGAAAKVDCERILKEWQAPGRTLWCAPAAK